MTRPDEPSPPLEDTANAPRPLAPGVLSHAVPLREALEGIAELWQLPRIPRLPAGLPSSGGGARARRPGDPEAPRASGSPGRQTGTRGMPTVGAPTPRRAGVPAWAWAAGVAIAAGLAWWSVQPPSLRRDPMPAAMRATWQTAHPDYARAAMLINDSLITFVTVDASAADPTRPIAMRHRITGLRTTPRGDTTDVTLTYDAEGDPIELAARLVGGATPSLTFVRPEGLTWYPAATAYPSGS